MMSFKLFPSSAAILVIAALILAGHAGIVTPRPAPKDFWVREGSQKFLIFGATGPESLAFDKDGGGPYTGVSDGRIIKWQANENRWIDFAITTPYRYGCEGLLDHVWTEARCGRPLGLSFHYKTGDLYIADAYMGLMVVGPDGGLARPLATEADGVPFKFTNGLVVDQNTSMVYFTDSSTKFQRSEYAYVTSTHDNTGRLLKFEPSTNQVTVLLNNLMFPNGVALSKSGDFLLVTETTNSRVLKFWLEPSKFGTVELFAQLPGRPDNISRNQNGEFWVPVNSNDGVEHRFGMAIKLGENGEVLQMLEDANGETWMYGSDTVEENGSLWIGSVVVPYVARLKISN